METKSMILPLVVITGPTASGKTSLAIKLAKEFGGEVICADSRTVYKGMDVGTAKPTQKEMDGVPHWGIDLVNPNEYFSAAQFKDYALSKIDEIRKRGNIPFIVGGTGLYVDSVLFDYKFGPKVNVNFREYLNNMSVNELQTYCLKNNIELPKNAENKRYIIRSIEQNGVNDSRRLKPIRNSIVVGISTEKQDLRARIEKRVEDLFNNGAIDEAVHLGETYGWNSEAMTGNLYRLAKAYFKNEISRDDFYKQLIVADWRLAKRQLTWLRRNSYIKWLNLEQAREYLSVVLAKYK